MRVLVSAYACEPGSGSEPGAGWEWARAASIDHDVWLLTRHNSRPAIDRALRQEPSLHLHPVYVDLPPAILRLKRRRADIYWYYLLWQVVAWRRARRLQRDVGLDIVHHVTLAADWMPAGLALLGNVPLIWGPVGGSTGTPWRLWRWLGLRGCASELARETATRLGRCLFGRPMARRATVVLAQNHDVAHQFRRLARTVVEPHTAVRISGAPESRALRGSAGPSQRRRAVFLGRLIPWKGPRLAIAALARSPAAQWSLDIYGEGYERASLERLARRLGVDRRIAFRGQRPRAEVLEALNSADALLFPSMHDSAPFAVAEALASGCPVACLDRGGPAVLVQAGDGVKVPADRAAVQELAYALASLDSRIPPVGRWSAERLPGFLRILYKEAVAAGRPSPPLGRR
jgi:glycosyltransferase involved in cell wall biosynthesis